ncbi:MAG: DUF378 domain-containing protein [Candidatus Omnitrophota bacterium]|nr:DUF378 domain-containing protein [Candidatus Omnitrophota bacterium]
MICKIAGILAIVGCLNWGAVGLLGTNVVENILGAGSTLTRVVYILVGLSGIVLLMSCCKACPVCKKT